MQREDKICRDLSAPEIIFGFDSSSRKGRGGKNTGAVCSRGLGCRQAGEGRVRVREVVAFVPLAIGDTLLCQTVELLLNQESRLVGFKLIGNFGDS